MAADNSSEKEILEGESPGSASDLNRSDRDPIYIGGLPMSRPIRYAEDCDDRCYWLNPGSIFIMRVEPSLMMSFPRRQVVARSYVGCIKNMEIARSNFDLLRDAYGVRKGCVLEVPGSTFSLSAPASFLSAHPSKDAIPSSISLHLTLRICLV